MSTTFLNTGTGAGGVAASTVTLQAVFDFIAGQSGQSVNFSLFNPESPALIQSISLASGANTINSTNCPAIATAAGVFIMPPLGQGATLTLKGVTGDTGIAIAFTGAPTYLAFANPPLSTFVITSSSTVTGLLLAWV